MTTKLTFLQPMLLQKYCEDTMEVDTAARKRRWKRKICMQEELCDDKADVENAGRQLHVLTGCAAARYTKLGMEDHRSGKPL